LSTRGFGDTDWTDGFSRPWDVSVASFEAIETDLDELIDPDGLESAMAIDDQGNFLAWMDSERGMAPMPVAVSEFEAPVAQDLNAPAAAKGSQGFKRFTPPVPAVETNDPSHFSSDGFKPSSDAIDAVFAELEASAKASAEGSNTEGFSADAPEVEAHANVESDSDIYAEAHSEDHDDQDDAIEAKSKPKIDPMALEDAFESVPFDLPELMGEQPVALADEAEVEAQADAPEVEAQAEVLETEAPAIEAQAIEAQAEVLETETVQAETVAVEAIVIPEGEPVEPVAAWKKPVKPEKKQPSEFGIDEVPLEALLEVVNTEAEDEGNHAEAEAVTTDLQPEAEALAAVGLGEANLEEGILAAYEMDGPQITDLSALIESGKALENSAASDSVSEPVVPAPVHAGFAASVEETETPESVLDALETSVLGFETPEIQPLDAELETDSSVAAVLAPEIMNVPMMPATTTLRRHFDATDLLEAQIRLRHALRPLDVSMVSLLGRAAERCALELPGIKTIALAELGDKGIEITAKIKAVESFREMLTGIAEGSSGVRGDLSVVDISDLGLDEVVLPLAGPHLLLTRLSSHPDKPGRMRGTVSLSGLVNLRAGASFLDQVVSKLEAPITLMV
jgi:hypothetical protein